MVFNLLSWLTVAFLSVQILPAQVTFKTFSDPDKSGLEKIVFQYTDSTTLEVKTNEFDVQQNNPYNKLPLVTIREAQNGSTVKEFPIKGRKELYDQLGLKYDSSLASAKVPLNGISHIMMSTGRENYLVIAYNLFLYGQYGDLSANGR